MKFNKKIRSVFSFSYFILGNCEAFCTGVPIKLINSHSIGTDALRASNDDNIPKDLHSRTCIHQFLTQRSIQSFMFLLNEMHDPHTTSWIQNVVGSIDMLSYYGTGAFDLKKYKSWDSFLQEMIQRPMDVISVETRQRYSGNNPFLKAKKEVSLLINTILSFMKNCK